MLVTMTRLWLAIIFNGDSYMCARCYRIGFFFGSFFGFFFANWSLVACSDNSAKEYVMLLIVAVVTLTVRAPLMSSSSVMICFART